MTWIKLSDDFSTHPKVISLSDAAMRALIESYCYAARHRTDGHLPHAVVTKMTTKKTREELLAARLWDTNGDGGLVIHDYLDYNPSKAEQERSHKAKVEGGRAGAKARWQHRA